jgi:hypothetical protein
MHVKFVLFSPVNLSIVSFSANLQEDIGELFLQYLYLKLSAYKKAVAIFSEVSRGNSKHSTEANCVMKTDWTKYRKPTSYGNVKVT